MPSTPLITLENVSFTYPSEALAVLNSFSLVIRPGEIIQLRGRNGAGKSTLLKLIAGQLEPTAGRIAPRSDLRAVYMDQQAGDMLANGLSIKEHFQLRSLPTHKQAGRGGALPELLLEGFDVGLENRGNEFTGHLSGGQRQIAALLSALKIGANLLCLDEFAANLDPKSVRAASRVIVEYFNTMSVDGAVVFAAHNFVPVTPNRTLDL